MSVDLRSGARVTVRTPRLRVTLTRPPRGVALVPVRGPIGPPGEDTSAALAAHIASHNPHPTYDQMVDLALLYDNGLV